MAVRPPLLAALLLLGCAPARNYTDPAGPRYSGRHAALEVDPAHLKVVTFNIRYAQALDAAIETLRAEASLADADIVTLQEMDAPGVERLAQALGYDYVYYPAAVHPKVGHDFGEAILTRGLIEEDHKLILPGLSRGRRMQRIAVAATVRLRALRLHVYSTHTETPFDLGAAGRQAQVEAILRDAARYGNEPVLLAGDFNDRERVGATVTAHGFRWLTEGNGNTLRLFSWDHVFARGLAPAGESVRAGVVLEHRGASDHFPVWVEVKLPGPPRLSP